MSEFKPSWKSEEDKEDEEEDDSIYTSQKDAVLFAIDISKTMLTFPPISEDKRSDKYSPAIAALECANQIMQQRIISNPKDMMGILLFGTEKSKFQDGDENSRAALNYPHCYLLTNLNIPSAEDVKLLRDVVAGDEEYDDLLLPSSEPVSMPNLLFCANQIFTTSAPSFGSRRLFIITDNDDPHADNKAAAKNAATRGKDLNDLGITIELFPISHPDHQFDRTKFYDNIIYRDPSMEEDAATVAQTNLSSSNGDGITLLASLISDINSKQVSKRTLFSNLPFEIGPDFIISVKGYNLIQEQKLQRSHYLYMGGEERQIATGISSRADDNAVAVTNQDEVRKAFSFGGSQIIFSPSEMKDLKNFGSPVLRVIGFKPQKMLPFWASVKKSTFIFPTEEHYVGSTRVFASFWKKLLKDKLMALAWYIPRSNATPLIVAILPSEERLDEVTKLQTNPAGLWLCPIPFADDIRDCPPVPKPLRAPDPLVDSMMTIVRQLQLPKAVYNPAKYPNPVLQWNYKVIKALALDDELEGEAQDDDKTIPKAKQINKRAGEYIYNWGVILEEESQACRSELSVKRGSEDIEPPKKKRVKPESSGTSLDTMSNEGLKGLVASDTLGKHTVAQLKDLCFAKKLSASGKKADLIERIEQWVEEN